MILTVRYEYATFKGTVDLPGHPSEQLRTINSDIRQISKTCSCTSKIVLSTTASAIGTFEWSWLPSRISYLQPFERKLIRHFAERMGLEFGELDILRDAESGRIFVVDVNDTPSGPPNHISEAAGRKAIEAIAESFETRFVDSTTRRGES